jgi:hypothetical protein
MNHEEFPRPFQLGPNVVAWLETEVEDWLSSRKRGCIGARTWIPDASPERDATLIAARTASREDDAKAKRLTEAQAKRSRPRKAREASNETAS